MVAVKMDEKMVLALQRQAEREFSSVSGIIKKAVDAYLKEQGFAWQDVKPNNKTKSK